MLFRPNGGQSLPEAATGGKKGGKFLERINGCRIGLCRVGPIMNLQEQGVRSGGDGRSRQDWAGFAMTAGLMALPTRALATVRRIKDNGGIRLH